jgi:Holliday junction resolvase
MPRSAKGSRRERELLEFLTKKGFVVHRVAGSGVKEEAICDLVAVKDGGVQFIECKSRIKVYYTKEHLDQLNELIRISGTCKAKPILAVKLNYRDWQFFELENGIPAKVF